MSRTNAPGPLESLELAAAARRAELAESYLSGEEAQARLGINAEALKAWRKERRVLAVWHAPVQAWLYPDFQFDGGGLIKEMLDDRRPMDVMAQDPRSVLRAARIEFWEDPSTF